VPPWDRAQWPREGIIAPIYVLCTMARTIRLLFCIALAALASPAFAADGIPLPEAPNIMLFALGVLGVLIGRRVAMRKGGDEGE
jgi:hypothetical protein